MFARMKHRLLNRFHKEGGENIMARAKKNNDIAELKELLLNESGTVEEGILNMARKQFISDLHQRKIARIIEILEKM